MKENMEGIASAIDHKSYLLRMWRNDSTPFSWRVSIEDTHTGERLGFASLEELFAFLMQVGGGIHVDSKD